MSLKKDPFGWLGQTRPSQCCKDSEEEIIAYDHTGYVKYKCKKCGKTSGWQL